MDVIGAEGSSCLPGLPGRLGHPDWGALSILRCHYGSFVTGRKHWSTISLSVPSCLQAHAWLAAAAATVAAAVVAAVTAIVSAATATAAVAEQQNQDHDPPPVVIQTAAETVIVTHKITSAIIFVEL